MNKPIEANVEIPMEVELAKKLVYVMDEAIRIPVINKRIGLDPIIGIVPIVGDIVSALISVLIVVGLVRHGAPSNLVFKMIVNVVVDFVLGGIPVIGDLWDFFFKANSKNLKLFIEYHSQLSSDSSDIELANNSDL